MGGRQAVRRVAVFQCVCVYKKALAHFSLLHFPLVSPPDNRSPSTQRTVFDFWGDGYIIQPDKLCHGETKIIALLNADSLGSLTL